MHSELAKCEDMLKAISELTESRCAALCILMRQQEDLDVEAREMFDASMKDVSVKVVSLLKPLIDELEDSGMTCSYLSMRS